MVRFDSLKLNNENGNYATIEDFDIKTRTIKVWTIAGAYTQGSLDCPEDRLNLAEFISYHLYHSKDSFQVPIIERMLVSIRDMVGITDK